VRWHRFCFRALQALQQFSFSHFFAKLKRSRLLGGIDCPPFVHELTEKYTLEHFIIELCALHQLIPHSEVAKLEAEILTKLEAEDAVNSPEVTPPSPLLPRAHQ